MQTAQGIPQGATGTGHRCRAVASSRHTLSSNLSGLLRRADGLLPLHLEGEGP